MTAWTVLKAAHPESAILTLPSEVLKLLDLEESDLVSRSQPERDLVFLWRPKGWLRVMPYFSSTEKVAQEARMDRVLGRAPISGNSTGSRVLNLPLNVVQYLRLKDHEGADESPRAPMASIAWIAPRDEWDAIRWKGKGGSNRRAERHVYLARDGFEGALPTLADLEGVAARPRLIEPKVWQGTERFSYPATQVAAQMFRRPAIARSMHENAGRKWTYEWSADGGGDLERRWAGKLTWRGKVRFLLVLTETIRQDASGCAFVSRLETRSPHGRVHELVSSEFYRAAIDWQNELEIRTAYAREVLGEAARRPDR